MKRIGLTLIVFLLMTSVALARDEYCKNVGDVATNCQKESEWNDTGKMYLNDDSGRIRPWEYVAYDYYITVRNPSHPDLEAGNKWIRSYTYTWNAGTSEWYKTQQQIVNTGIPTLREVKDARIESEYERIDALLSEQCEYPDANGFRIPYSTKDEIHKDVNRGTPDSYFVYDIDNSVYVELTPNGANDAAKIVTLKTILSSCKSEFKSEKDILIKDHPDTENASCTDAQLPWDCCTGAGTGGCDADSFIDYVEKCADKPCVNSLPFTPVDHSGTT